MYHFHIVFLDTVCPKPYDSLTLEHGSLGGTESAVLRVANGLGRIGLKVAVIQQSQLFFPPIAGDNFLILHHSMVPEVTCDAAVHLRSVGHFGLWPKARQFVWVHDDPIGSTIDKWLPYVEAAGATMIAVSSWQRDAIKSLVPKMPVVRLYPPVDDKYYIPPSERQPIEKNNMVWMASPHKGLKAALPAFRKLREAIPNLTLTAMNPGYFHEKVAEEPGLQFMGETPRNVMRSVVQRSLCLFYPTQFRETFGLIAAEAEACGVPVACYKIAALAESVGASGWCENEESLIEVVKGWHKQRPEIMGQTKFQMQNLLQDYVRVLDGKMPAQSD